MAKRKNYKKKAGRTNAAGSLKGFILLAVIIAGCLFVYENYLSSAQSPKELVAKELNSHLKEIQEGASEMGEKLSEKVGQLTAQPEETATASSTSYRSKLEIPVLLKKKEEIKLSRIGYTLSYNPYFKTPNWVAWELTRQETDGNEKRKNRFLPDPDLPEPKVVHADYTHSGYDRGHMAPAADMKWSKRAMEESFYMSNICPQNQKLNRDDWGDLEEICRKWAQKYGRVYIACGPIYDQQSPKRIGEHRVAVPDRFYKVVLIYNRKNPVTMGFLFENKAHHQDISKYMVSVDSIENITGMDFFSKLPDETENRIEALIPAMPAY